MAKYKLTITDLETGEVMQEVESDTFVFHSYSIDDDGDDCIGSGVVHSGTKLTLAGVLSNGIRYHKKELAKLFDLFSTGEDE